MRSHEGNDSGQAIIDVVPARAVTRSKLCFRILFKDAYIPARKGSTKASLFQNS